MSAWYRWDGTDLILTCRLQPRASRDEIVGPEADAVKIRITAPPVDGKANQHLIRYLADCFNVPQRQIVLEHGLRGRHKRLRIQDPCRIPAKLNMIEAPGN